MSNHNTVDGLLGKRYTTTFQIVAIGGSPTGLEDDRIVVLRLYGDNYQISLGELLTLITSGLMVEDVRSGG